ncbi:Alpha/Beta hydrolase protein [Chytriomyces sp. MP71]|nr:Alpha/Beta hydrolase protein [Chytriomyces sp. MP71]
MSADLVPAAAILALTSAAVLAAYVLIVPDTNVDLGSLATAKAASANAEAAVETVYPLRPESQFVKLTAGTTHFYMCGSKSGRRIALLHGILGTWASCPEFVDGLVKRGFHVLVFELYGRGYSSSPGTNVCRYSGTDYAKQLKELLDHVGWDTAIILGNSLCGGIAIAFADLFPERVDKVLLVAPAGLMKDIPWTGKIALLPVIGSIFGYSLGNKILKARGNNLDSMESPQIKHAIAIATAQIDYHPGILRAFLETVRSGPIRGGEGAYNRVGARFGSRVLCVWGNVDTVVDFKELSPVFTRLMPDAKLVVVDKIGHELIVDGPHFVLDSILEFLNER